MKSFVGRLVDLCQFWLKSTSRSLSPFVMLVAVDWAQWQRDAGEFLRKHPGAKVKELTRAERLLVPQARAAWAAVHFRAGAVAREHGAQPCDLCGEWTGSFCEGCEAVPYAVCTACDADRLLCHHCVSSGKLYSEVERTDLQGYVEITGYNNEKGEFVRYDTPVRFPASDVPQRPDGTFDIDELMQYVELGRRPGQQPRAKSGSAASRSA